MGNERAAVIVGEGSGIEDNKPSLSSRQEVPSGGRLPVSLSPSLPVWLAAGGRGGSRAGQATFGAAVCRQRGAVAWRCQTHPTPALPHPWPGWAAVSVGKAALPVSPAAPPSNSATARPLRGGAAALQLPHNNKPGLRLASRQRLRRCLLRFFSTQAHPPCLAPSSRRTASESRLERKGLVRRSTAVLQHAFEHLRHELLLCLRQSGQPLHQRLKL